MPIGGFLPKVPSRLVDWRGPRAKYQVTLSVRPSTWHAAHDPHAAPFSDQRPSPVVKRRLPLSTDAAAVPAAGAAEDATSPVALAETACTLRLTAVTVRVPSLATK